MNWRYFNEFQNKWQLKNVLVKTTLPIDPSKSFPVHGWFTMGGERITQDKNMSDKIIPAETLGYMDAASAKVEGSMVHFFFGVNPDLLQHNYKKAISAMHLNTANKITIRLSDLDMRNIQIYIGGKI